MLHHEVIKTWEAPTPEFRSQITKRSWIKLRLKDRIEKFNIKNCFLTLKGHKSDFRTKPECKLINPSKT